jgi:hypothetical protein
MKTIPVAAVYDRRGGDDFGSHRQPLQEDEFVVAAVCDRRVENDPGAHGAPLQNLGSHRQPLQIK